MMKTNDKSKQQSYFSIIEIIDEIFPPISVFDYTKISKEDLRQRFQKIIEEKVYEVSKEKMTYILNEIESKHELIYGKDHHALKGFTTEKDFDQRNYSIQNYVSSLKSIVINQICNKHLKYLYNGKINYKYNTTYMGNIENIKIVNNRERIANYIFSTLNVSKENVDWYNLDCETIAKDILLHFGISPNEKDSLKPNNFLIDITKKIQYTFSVENKEISPPIPQATIEITEYIFSLLSHAIESTIEEELLREETLQEQNSNNLEILDFPKKY